MDSKAQNLSSSLSLAIFYRGEPAQTVPEYAEVELRLSNTGDAVSENLEIWLGGQRLRTGLRLEPGSGFATTFNVGDLVGDLVLSLRSGQGLPVALAALQVAPQKLSLTEVGWIKTERLPTLLARLDAPNSLRLRYRPIQEQDEAPLFDFISADFTALKLRHYCQTILEGGLAERILQKLEFSVSEEIRREEGFIRGQVRWTPTVQGWASRPTETGLVHQWAESERDYNNPLNRLFVAFGQKLAAECCRLVRLVQAGAPASARLQASLAEFEGYAARLEQLWQGTILRPVAAGLAKQAFGPGLEWVAAEKMAGKATNPAYRRLVELWQAFNSRYVDLPDDEPALQQTGLQPLSAVYELWVACEVAHALQMDFAPGSRPGLESAIFQGTHGRLYYNQGAAGGWYSDTVRKQPPRPDLRLEGAAGRLLLDVKYRRQSGRANPDDMYRMLAYMNDFGVAQGGIIYPGAGLPEAVLIRQPGPAGQLLAELPLRPPAGDVSEWQAALKASLEKILAG